MNNQPAILVVDDELLIRDLLYDFFSGQGWHISVADSAEKALEILEEKEVDLVLTDLRMPTVNGLDLATQLSQERPELPIVVMTGYPSVETAVAALRLRVADYITKPFNINELYKSLERHVRLKQAETDQVS